MDINKDNKIIDGYSFDMFLNRWDIIFCDTIVMYRSPLLLLIWVFFSWFITIYLFKSDRFFLFCLVLVEMYLSAFILRIFVVFLNRKLKNGILGQHTCTITEQGLVEETEINHTTYKWSGLDQVISIFGYIIVSTSDQGRHYIPHRCFANNAEANEVVEELKRRIREGR